MSAEIIRIECDALNKEKVYDARGKNRILTFWRGSDVELQLALTQDGKFLLSSDMGRVIVELKDELSCPSDPSIWRTEVLTGNTALTEFTWKNGAESLVSPIIPKAITQRLIPKNYWLIVRHVADEGTSTHLSHFIKVQEDRSYSTETYNFGAAGTTSTATGTPVTTTLTVPINGGQTSPLVVTAPTGFTPSNMVNHYVTGLAGEVELSDTVQLGANDITFYITSPPADDNTHSLVIEFLKLT